GSSEIPLHSSLHSTGPSRKRCRSLTDFVPLSTQVTGSLAPTRADLLPPHKRFIDSYSSETSMEEDTEIDTIEIEDGRELDIFDRNDARDRVKIDPRDVRDDTEEYEADTSARDMVEVVKDMLIDLDAVVHDFYHHMSEVCIDRIVRIETTQRQLEADQLIACGERVRMTKRIETLRSENLKIRALSCIESNHVDNLQLMRLMTKVYCPRNEIQKMETELWNLVMKGNDLTVYTRRFQELVLLCTRMVPSEEEKVERFVGGLPDNIQGNVITAEPILLQDAIRIANNLMDQKLKGYAISAKNKRMLESN
nr:reverse transcriptase domain-containing protein [Tanacetum cinerariifolium]